MECATIHLETQLTIAAPPSVVWAAFVNRARWRHFSDLMDLDPGRPMLVGSWFWLGIRLGGILPTPMPVQVIRRVEARELVWVGSIPGLRGEHFFRFAPEGEGWTRMVHGEDFSGPLGVLLARAVGRTIEKMYATFNHGLAQEVETP